MANYFLFGAIGQCPAIAPTTASRGRALLAPKAPNVTCRTNAGTCALREIPPVAAALKSGVVSEAQRSSCGAGKLS